MATLVTRTLPTKREQAIATLLLALSIPCSAQLGVILALLGANPLRLLVWQERPGRTQFAVTAATPFAGEPRALALIGSLPGKLRDDARMLQFSRKDVRFLSRLDEPASRLATAQDKDR
jgi:hypothetical protein